MTGMGIRLTRMEKALTVALAILFVIPPGFAQTVLHDRQPVTVARDRKPVIRDREPLGSDSTVNVDVDLDLRVLPDDRETLTTDSLNTAEADNIPPTVVTEDGYSFDEKGRRPFNPNPTRAVWMSALFPGLGQIYNRRYWKLPIVVGGFMGLGYATSWNGNQYNDYMQGYRDLMDSDPNTKSYMNFFPPTVNESDLDKAWLERTFKYRKDQYRRYRDLCIICLVALYLVCMVDAYVDAQMAHFDVSPDLSLDLAPAIITPQNQSWKRTSLGLQWTLTF